MGYGKADVENWFVYHPATDVTGPIHDSIRLEFRQLALNLYDMLPEGPDRTIALRKVQEAMWAANAAIACAPVAV